jgi:hypothetical protein
MDEPILRRNEMARVLEKPPPVGREFDMASVPREQDDSNLALEIPYVTAQDRLGNVQAPRGSAETALVGYRDKGAEVTQLHIGGGRPAMRAIALGRLQRPVYGRTTTECRGAAADSVHHS